MIFEGLRLSMSFRGLCFLFQKLHDLLITSVINAPCSWFDATPVGRIVNRFSQDIATVDSSIILQMFGFMDKLLSTVQIVIIICVSL